jgi:hypothetical protein
MEIEGYYMEKLLNHNGIIEHMNNNFIKSRFEKVLSVDIESNDDYYNFLVSLSEYSLMAFAKDAVHNNLNISKGNGSFANLFHYDYSNNIDYSFIYTNLKNPIIKTPIYQHYCDLHKDEQKELCLNCLERYRVITRNLIPLMKTLRKDLCSIYFTDMLYDLIRFENRHLYAFITHMINEFSDGSSFKRFATNFGKKKIQKLLKGINKPFRRIDFKMILKKYIPLLYSVFAYCANIRIDCLDRVYDFMLYKGLSMFKTVPNKYIVVGYKVDTNYRIDIIETSSILDFSGNDIFQIASHPLLEGLNFGFHTDRQIAYNEVNKRNDNEKKKLRKKYDGFKFNGKSVFTGHTIYSDNTIIIGFLKESENTFQNFRLDIHITSIIPNHIDLDKMRFINHDKWIFEDNEYDLEYNS